MLSIAAAHQSGRNPAQVESAAIYGLSAALHDAITIKEGRVEQSNFNDYQMPRMSETPLTEVHVVMSKEEPTGIGEPGLQWSPLPCATRFSPRPGNASGDFPYAPKIWPSPSHLQATPPIAPALVTLFRRLLTSPSGDSPFGGSSGIAFRSGLLQNSACLDFNSARSDPAHDLDLSLPRARQFLATKGRRRPTTTSRKLA